MSAPGGQVKVSRLSSVAQFLIFGALVAAAAWQWGIWTTVMILTGLGILTVLGMVFYSMVIAERSPQRRMAAWAMRRRWTYLKADAMLATRVPPTLASGFDGMFREVFAGQVDGRTFRSFIHIYRTEPKNETFYVTDLHLRYDWVVLVEGLPASRSSTRGKR